MISSSVILSSFSLILNILHIKFVDKVSNFIKGLKNVLTNDINPINKHAILYGLFIAIFLGTNSPNINVTYDNINVIIITNIVLNVELDINDDMKNILSTIKESKYTRFPVYDKNEIIGILNVKDFILNYNELKDLRSIVRTVNKYEYTEKIDDVFRMMQKNNEPISLIYNKKEMVGIVTIEDAIEEIVGNIFEEYDGEKKYEQI